MAQRLNALNALALDSANVRTVDHVKCTGRAHFLKMFAGITEAGGEGVMLRRTSDLLKALPFAA